MKKVLKYCLFVLPALALIVIIVISCNKDVLLKNIDLKPSLSEVIIIDNDCTDTFDVGTFNGNNPILTLELNICEAIVQNYWYERSGFEELVLTEAIIDDSLSIPNYQPFLILSSQTPDELSLVLAIEIFRNSSTGTYQINCAGEKHTCIGQNCSNCKLLGPQGNRYCDCKKIADPDGGPASCIHTVTVEFGSGDPWWKDGITVGGFILAIIALFT